MGPTTSISLLTPPTTPGVLRLRANVGTLALINLLLSLLAVSLLLS